MLAEYPHPQFQYPREKQYPRGLNERVWTYVYLLIILLFKGDQTLLHTSTSNAQRYRSLWLGSVGYTRHLLFCQFNRITDNIFVCESLNLGLFSIFPLAFYSLIPSFVNCPFVSFGQPSIGLLMFFSFNLMESKCPISVLHFQLEAFILEAE